MYIEYITPQQVADPNYTKYNSKGGEFRPTWLIRASDWKKVPGSEATDGYHTLSYCWEQSGEKFQKDNGKYDLVDDGRHRLVTKFLEKRKTRRSVRYRKRTQTKHVKYDELLQQLCKDFDIDYLWYDKICINQTNKVEKLREIKQMHLIYSNARYTIALVPEVNIEDPKEFEHKRWDKQYKKAKSTAINQMMVSLWFKRSWTLEELMMSTQILIVGRNTHFWSLADIRQGETVKENEVLANDMLLFKDRKYKSANQVLRHAHFRTSTKVHDKIFALANIFYGLVSIDIDYRSDISLTMNNFYRQLAELDPSIMLFGTNVFPWDGEPVYVTTMSSHGLPSWTGVSGLHSARPVTGVVVDKNSGYNIDSNMCLHLKCRSYTIQPIKYSNYGIYFDNERGRQASKTYLKVISSMADFDDNEQAALDWSQWCIWQGAGYDATHYWKPHRNVGLTWPILPLSITEECDECVILGVIITSVNERVRKGRIVGFDNDYYSPIAKKSNHGSTYRIIGVVLLKHFRFDEPRDSPEEFMNKFFDQLGCETNDFCIK